MPWPKAGTVAVTLNSTTVTGTSTAFAANARVGDGFKGPDGAWYEITNIASDTVLSILPAYAGATGTGKAYAIVPVQGYDKALADAFNALVQQFGTQLGSNSFKALTALVGAANKLPYFTAADGMATTDFTAQARELLNDASYGAMLTTLGFSDFMKTVVDDADQATALATLGAASAGLPAAGTNLLNDDYSWLGATAPVLVMGQSLAALPVAVANAASGYGYQCTLASTAATQYLMLCPVQSAAGYNIDLVPGTYLVSAYIQGSAAGTIRTSLYSGTHRYSDTVAFTTARTRVTMTVVVTDSARAAITFYPNMSGLAAGTTVTIDSVMIETRLGSTSTPSAFVAGPSAPAVARLASTSAKSGANSDITALSGLTTALSVAQGGTGVKTIAALLTALITAGAYAKTNILGTVSQASGVPTGAVIETGTNANGTYTKYADGTMICTGASAGTVTTSTVNGTVYYGTVGIPVFPATFSTAPKVSYSSERNANFFSWVAQNTGATTTAPASVYVCSLVSTAVAGVSYIAIGRWF
jgi:hypothetical protein